MIIIFICIINVNCENIDNVGYRYFHPRVNDNVVNLRNEYTDLWKKFNNDIINIVKIFEISPSIIMSDTVVELGQNLDLRKKLKEIRKSIYPGENDMNGSEMTGGMNGGFTMYVIDHSIG